MEDNMAALVVGGDNIESLREELHAQGIRQVTHLTGRKNVEKHNLIPRNVELVVVLVNYVNHSLSSRVKKEAKRLKLPVIYSRNSRHSLATGGVLH
jgi:hypothetical protein